MYWKNEIFVSTVFSSKLKKNFLQFSAENKNNLFVFWMKTERNHACLSSELIYWIITRYLNTCGNSGANTPEKPQTNMRGAFIRSKLIGPSCIFYWLWITLGWAYGLALTTYSSNVYSINFRLWQRRPQWFWWVTENQGSIHEKNP